MKAYKRRNLMEHFFRVERHFSVGVSGLRPIYLYGSRTCSIKLRSGKITSRRQSAIYATHRAAFQGFKRSRALQCPSTSPFESRLALFKRKKQLKFDTYIHTGMSSFTKALILFRFYWSVKLLTMLPLYSSTFGWEKGKGGGYFYLDFRHVGMRERV